MSQTAVTTIRPRETPGPPHLAPVRVHGWWLRPWLLVAVTSGGVVGLIAALAWIASHGGYYLLYAPTGVTRESEAPGANLEAGQRQQLERRLAALAPRGLYVVIDSYHNRLRIFRDGELVRDAVCSTGSGAVLRDPVSGREWIFDTPLGERRIERKVREPIWFKPDWAFVEEGYLPPQDLRIRADDLSLGSYGLYIGDGYLLHGTLFQTLLGRKITHGCIRLGDADLEYLYRAAPLGTRVYVY